jgi:hypothetical protein
MKRSILSICLLFLVSLVPAVALAETGVQLGVPGTNVPNDPIVKGMRFSFLSGKNQSTNGFDIGLLSLSETSRMSGLGLIAGVSKVTGETKQGVIFSLVNYHTGKDSGVNGAFINLLNDASGAFNTGFVTIAQGGTMIDFGGFNMSQNSVVQIGFINVTERIESFQFGFLNIAENGFLPIFPVFNFPKSK